jgi:hypothetical protein
VIGRFKGDGPGYWPNETSGQLRPAVEAYLWQREMTPQQIAVMRAYLRQWIFADVWQCDGEDDPITSLRERIDELTSIEAITGWLDDAEKIGIDPL